MRIFARVLSRAVFAVAVSAAPAFAQQSLPLRGGITNPNVAAVAGAAGATGEEDATTGSIFDPDETENPFAAAPIPTPRPPSTAARRAAGRRSAAGQQPGRPLEEEETETPANERAQSVDALDEERNFAVKPENLRVEPIEGLPRRPEENPYAPLGLRLGTFLVSSSLEQGLGWTSNADASPGGSPAAFSETTLRLNAVSDWSTHSAALAGYGAFRESISGAEISDPQAGLDGDLILELGSDYRALASLNYDLRRESATSPVDLPPTTSRPLRHLLTGGLGLEKDAGKFLFGIRGNVERLMFGDAELEGGGTLSQRERNSTLGSVALRAGYEISPAITPFVEAEIGRRVYDQELDSNGFARSATRFGARGGVAVDLGEKFSGEASAGWLMEDLDDERLPSISGAWLNADLFWSPVRGTRIGLQAATTVEGTTTAGEAGSLLYSGRLSAERELRANLTSLAAAGAQWRDYAGSNDHDLTLSAEAELTWWLNRYAGLVGRARHEIVESSRPDRDSETTSVFLGLKLQR